ncbi:unnamed protein product [Trifolium pratense]|uniref:Uncharacterized protein n=1 Tax=Trifolium pratense TaxID=57577 RepID=A0ACB0IIJ3_TRIPR|nr:unnamed protein product [Trifolium pratense]
MSKDDKQRLYFKTKEEDRILMKRTNMQLEEINEVINEKEMGDKKRLEMTEKLIVIGSHGTKVYEGRWQTRDAAIKRIPCHQTEKASNEINAYIQHDKMPFILRCLYHERDNDYYNLVLERANCNLLELILACRSKNCICGHNNKKCKDFLEMASTNEKSRL